MDASRVLRRSRRRAGLTQRQLAARTGVAQPTIARIEVGREFPRVDTMSRLLRACGERLESVPRGGRGVDRTQIRELRALTPAERVHRAREEAEALDALDRAVGTAKRGKG